MSDNRQYQEYSSSGGSDRTHDRQMRRDLEDREEIANRLSNIGHKILVLSGKGGVGKSTVAANLAIFLSQHDKKVGLLDIDIHGPSVPKLLGLEDSRAQGSEKMIMPIAFSDNLKVMSIGFLLQSRDDAVIWRGPMKYGVIKQFLKDVRWGDLDYLIVDSPPGTGDEPLSVAQLIERPDGAIILTTPQDLSVIDVRKCVGFCKKLHIPVLGVVENMSGFVCPSCGERVDIFKAGGGARMAQDLHVPYLGSIPIEPAIVAASDAGKSFTDEAKNSGAAAAFEQIATKILGHVRGAMSEVPDFLTGATRPKPETAAVTTTETNKENRVRIAMPLVGGKLAQHFGHCEEFAILDVDTTSKRTLNSERIGAPAHEPGLLPRWLREQNVNVIIAGGMGQRAKRLFDEQNIEVVVGVPANEPQELIDTYVAGTLEPGDNLCDH